MLGCRTERHILIKHSVLFDVRCFEGLAGTPGYVSPEMVNRVPYGRPVDIWASGRFDCQFTS